MGKEGPWKARPKDGVGLHFVSFLPTRGYVIPLQDEHHMLSSAGSTMGGDNWGLLVVQGVGEPRTWGTRD